MELFYLYNNIIYSRNLGVVWVHIGLWLLEYRRWASTYVGKVNDKLHLGRHEGWQALHGYSRCACRILNVSSIWKRRSSMQCGCGVEITFDACSAYLYMQTDCIVYLSIDELNYDHPRSHRQIRSANIHCIVAISNIHFQCHLKKGVTIQYNNSSRTRTPAKWPTHNREHTDDNVGFHMRHISSLHTVISINVERHHADHLRSINLPKCCMHAVIKMRRI